MRKLPIRATLAVAVLAAGLPALAAVDSKDVMCGKQKCGTMEISTYEKFSSGTNPATDVGGALIDGKFTASTKGTFHYLQALTTNTSDAKRWFNDTTVALPVPMVDTPPGGYKSQTFATGKYDIDDAFDYLPWYDEAGEFPGFHDRPALLYQRAKAKDISLQFETWVVCVIEDVPGTEAKVAKDDKYKVAPLLGFSWGFEIKYKDVGVIGTDEAADFSTTLTALKWVAAPTADWKSALGAKYGAGAKQDMFNIALGDCAACNLMPIPEPSSAWMWLPGLLALAAARRRLGRPQGEG